MDTELDLAGTYTNPDQNYSDLLLAELPSQYEMLGLVNEGGMGSIFKAQNRYTGSYVAIKLMRPDTAGNSAAIKRFYLEAKAASLLKHQHICRLLDFGVTTSGMPYLVMDWIEGKSLDEKVIHEQNVSVEEVIFIAKQVAIALGHAHKKNIVHRDLKPENIMLSESAQGNLEVQLVDFGIAKLFSNDGSALPGDALTKSGLALGTPKYMSPEQVTGKKIDNRSDIYSLGCVMYFALSGRPPHSGQFAVETLKKHLYEMPAKLDPALQVPDGLQAIIFKALEKNPDNRFNNMEEVVKELDLLHNKKADEELRNLINESQVHIQERPASKKFAGIIWFGIGFLVMYGASMVLQHFLESVDSKVRPKTVQQHHSEFLKK